MQNFEDTVEKNEIVLIDFWAGWCKPCQTFLPVFEEMAKHNTDIHFAKVNVEESKDLAEAFQVRGVPMLMGFKKGELVFEHSGLLSPPQLEELLGMLRTLNPDDLKITDEQEPAN